jgi:hypothetical protein
MSRLNKPAGEVNGLRRRGFGEDVRERTAPERIHSPPLPAKEK